MTSSDPAPSPAAVAESTGFPLPEILITGLYLVFGAVWVIGTDALVGRLMGNPPENMSFQTIKGLNFVVTTAVLYYFVLRRSFLRRRRAEQTVRVERERFELAARAATDAVRDLDIGSGRLWWSSGVEGLFGYPLAEVGDTLAFWTDRLHPEDRARVELGFHQAIQSPATLWMDEYRFRRRDGQYSTVQDRGFIIRGPGGRAVRMVGGMTDVTRRRETEQRLERSHGQLRALSSRIESLREEERTRIAREIHDQLGQLLTALKMDLRWMEKRLGSGTLDPALNPLVDKLVEAGELADSTIATVQKISSELRPGTLDHLGLAAALRHEAGRFAERTGISCTVDVPEPAPELSGAAGTGLFRIFQEALTNVMRHAEARAVRGSLRREGNDVVLTIEDDGKGISPEALADTRSLGLLGMTERAGALGGEVVIEAVQPHGTRVSARLPVTGETTRAGVQA